MLEVRLRVSKFTTQEPFLSVLIYRTYAQFQKFQRFSFPSLPESVPSDTTPSFEAPLNRVHFEVWSDPQTMTTMWTLSHALPSETLQIGNTVYLRWERLHHLD